jgi:hypothetical protein
VALDHLERVEFVGITEDLGSLSAAVASFWHQPAPSSIPRLRVNDHPLRAGDAPAELLEAIAEGTTVDAALYRRAVERNSARS